MATLTVAELQQRLAAAEERARRAEQRAEYAESERDGLIDTLQDAFEQICAFKRENGMSDDDDITGRWFKQLLATLRENNNSLVGDPLPPNTHDAMLGDALADVDMLGTSFYSGTALSRSVAEDALVSSPFDAPQLNVPLAPAPKRASKPRRKKSEDDDDDYGISADEADEADEEEAQISGDEDMSEGRRDHEEGTWEDLRKSILGCQLQRNQLEHWVAQPFFDDTVVGCYVRVNIGKKADESVYRLCEVVAIKNEDNGIAYRLLNQQFTRRKLTVRLGALKKSWPITQISNSEATPDEIEYWKKMCERDGVQLPTIEYLNEQQDKIKKAINFVYDDKTIDEMAAGGATHKQGNFAIQRGRLQLLRDAAQVKGDKEDYEKWSQELMDLDNREEKAKRKRAELEMQGLGVSHINQRHATRNFTIETEVGAANADERKDMIVNNKDDPHLRRPTRNICYFDLPKKKGEEEQEKVKEVEPAKPTEEEEDAAQIDLGGQLSEAHAFDLGLDIDELFVEKPAECVMPLPTIVRMQDTKRRFGTDSSYSLDEYLHIKQSAQEV